MYKPDRRIRNKTHMNEQVFFEGKNCPVVQKFEPRNRFVERALRERREQQAIDRRAAESKFLDAHEQGIHTL